MINEIKESIWNQFGASLEMLGNAINACPDEHWATETKFWYHAFHCLFFTDYYLTIKPETFSPPSPFDQSEFEDRMPERVYTKAELLEYTQFCREKCQNLIAGLDQNSLNARWVNTYKDYSIIEILLYNMRHVHHHAAQLNLILRQTIDDAPDWVSRAEKH